MNDIGLTLVDLLTVIVFTGIISAISVPSVIKVIHDMSRKFFVANALNT
nr:hypothetical protein [Niallia taxi]